ncbi:DUF4836 family protein [Aureispira anguillae]|uniref:DUF4836 family protein n=1 Tax=Aureispira anguillae TaxID=2864201 RepID=A0A916DRG7_9BACT|nr:DUF4836 family protein [Aureispira anguillae]BDS11256.1 DUF4836 family protein [Aureispira anguillae]
MLKTTKFLSAIFAFIILFSMSSCGDSAKVAGSSDISQSIPADATAVFLMNAKQLMQKADYATVKETDFFKDWIQEVEKQSPEMVPFLNDPEAAGISLAGNMGFYFSVPEDFMNSRNIEVAFILPVADKAKMDKAVKVALKDNKEATPETKDGYTITKLNKQMSMVQSDHILAFTTLKDETKINNLVHPSGDNIHTNASFAKHMKANKDVMFWMGVDPLVTAALNSPFTAMTIRGGLAGAQIPEEGLKGNSMSLFYDFKQGEMEMGTAFDFNDILKEELGDLFPNKLNIDYSNYIPSDNLAAAATFGVNSAGVLNFLTKRGWDLYADSYLSKAGLDLGKIRDGITGDLAVGIYPPASQATDPGLVVAMGIKDKKFVEGLFAQAGPFLKKDGDKYTFTGGSNMMDPSAAPMQLFAVVKDDILVVSNSNEQLEKAQAGNSNKIVNEIQDGWMGIYMDYNLINENYDVIANYLPIDPNSLAFSKMMNEYQNVSTATLLAKGDVINGTTTLKNKNVNSLKSLIESFDKMYKDRAKIQEQMDQQMKDEFEGFDEEFATEKENT